MLIVWGAWYINPLSGGKYSVDVNLWQLHLVSLERWYHFLFSQNRLKFAQYIPGYIEKMYNLMKPDPELWQFFCDGNVSVKKSRQDTATLVLTTLWSKLIELWK